MPKKNKVIGTKQLKLWASEPGKFTYVLISGKAGVGKSTVAKYMSEYLGRYDYHVFITSFAKKLKDCARDYFGWDGKKDERGRRLLQRIGSEIGREYDLDNWVKLLLSDIGKHIIYPDFTIVDDWRFPNEASFIESLEEFNVIKVRIDAPEREILQNTAEEQHPSENSLPTAEDGNGYYDFVIMNSKDTTLDNLRGLAEKIVDILLERSKK